ncbi:MAG TPA: hypothetical protein VLU73_16135 [Methylococcaceae bacterium]|nr:hypothetical protein [Methylococcaceae bacterium]
MIYVVEFPHQAHAYAWFAFEEQDFARKVQARHAGDRTLFAAATPRQQLEKTGHTPDSPGARTEYAGIFDLAEEYGWDTVLYRADYLLGEGVYQAEPASEFDACVAAIAHDLRACRVYLSDEAATAALYRDPLYDGPEGFHAHMALREQLIALEVISDDL